MGTGNVKFMGSKRVMLHNGLGTLIRTEADSKARIVDLFSGGASVSWFAAESIPKPVVSVDLQDFAKVLAKSVVERTAPIDAARLETNWLNPLRDRLSRSECWRRAQVLDRAPPNVGSWASRARGLCAQSHGTGVMWRAYGGYYFSPSQAIVFDLLRKHLPRCGPDRWVCHAALLVAASKCVAAPGHTAQPFATTRTAGPFLREAWLRDPLLYIRRALATLSAKRAQVQGKAKVGDAVYIARRLSDSDLVFVDPPYSGVHYSRFYHVLETLARGSCGPVSGTGRYPPPKERPVSLFSQRGNSQRTIEQLFRVLSARGCTVIVTFPKHECSNGLSGSTVAQAAKKHFAVERTMVKTSFSTLGGNGENRSARQHSQELILLLKPR